MLLTGIVPSLAVIEIVCLLSLASRYSSGDRMPLEEGNVISTSSSRGIGFLTRKSRATLTSMTLQSKSNDDEWLFPPMLVRLTPEVP